MSEDCVGAAAPAQLQFSRILAPTGHFGERFRWFRDENLCAICRKVATRQTQQCPKTRCSTSMARKVCRVSKPASANNCQDAGVLGAALMLGNWNVSRSPRAKLREPTLAGRDHCSIPGWWVCLKLGALDFSGTQRTPSLYPWHFPLPPVHVQTQKLPRKRHTHVKTCRALFTPAQKRSSIDRTAERWKR